MRSSRLGLALSSLLLVGSALSIAGCATIATHEEYRAYRTLRGTHEERARLEALASYAERFPNGHWIAEVNGERTLHEEEVWAGNNASADGLRFYLAVYPFGTYVEQAQQRLAALSSVGERREDEQERVEAASAEAAAAAAEARRQWVTRATQFWARTVLGIRNFGSPISQVARGNPEFAQAFGQAPEPLCTPTMCIKHYHGHYAIPVPGATRIERQMHVFLRIHLDRGRVQRIEVLMPNKGFSRWYELEERALITDEDPTQRQAAIEWALGRLEPIIAEVWAGARPIDVIPEPIAPISQSDQAASEHGEVGDAEEATPAPAAETPPPAEGGGAPEEGSIDQLLEQAAGGGFGGGESTESTTPDETVAAETLVLPFGLRAMQRGNVRVVVFAAGEEDYGEAYDGFYVEIAQD